MERQGCRCGLLIFQFYAVVFAVSANEFFFVIKDSLGDFVCFVVGQFAIDNQDVRDRSVFVVTGHTGVGRLGDGVLKIQIAVFLVHCIDCVGMVDHDNLGAGGIGQISDCSGWQATDPKESVDFAVFNSVDGLGHTEALTTHIFVFIQTCGFDQAESHDFRGATWTTCADAFAFQVFHCFDTAGFGRHDMHAVRV